jgi:hypothetical protein
MTYQTVCSNIPECITRKFIIVIYCKYIENYIFPSFIILKILNAYNV